MRPPEVTWRTEEPCPSCHAEMVLLDDGLPMALAECRACGHREIWDGTAEGIAGGGDDW